jgi:hypothetical protein
MKEFNTIEDVINDPVFRANVNAHWNKLINDRISRPSPKPGFYYKRDWYDRMDWHSRNTNYLLNNIGDIWQKKSSIPTVIRNVIEFVCNNAFHETTQFYANQDVKEPVL